MTSKPNSPDARPHFYVLLDRSGSMESMRADVIGGFNNLLAEQAAEGPDARLTLVQFDTENPQEVVVDARRITKVAPLTAQTFVPRGGTPLLDATGRLVTCAIARAEQRKATGRRPEAITIITITDGQENMSREFTRKDVLRLVKEREAAGWSFAFLGAGLDAYGDATAIGYDARSVQAWTPDAAGAEAAFASVSEAMTVRRQKLRAGAPIDVGDFYEGNKTAEADTRRRRGRRR